MGEIDDYDRSSLFLLLGFGFRGHDTGGFPAHGTGKGII